MKSETTSPKYCMFTVFDYKGGELMTTINKTSLGQMLSELFENVDFGEDPTEPEVMEMLMAEVNRDGFTNLYAGGEAVFCGKVYEVSGSTLKEIRIEDNLKPVAEYIVDNWF